MSGGAHALSKKIDDLNHTIKDSLETVLKTGIIDSINSVSQIMGNVANNPQVPVIINQITQILNEESDLNHMISNINRILDSIDNEQVKVIFADVSNIIHSINVSDLVSKSSEFLSTVNSIGSLFLSAFKFGAETNPLLKVIGVSLFNIAKSYLNDKDNEILKKLNEIHSVQIKQLEVFEQILIVNLATLRQQAFANLLTVRNLNFDVNTLSQEELGALNEAFTILRNTKAIRAETLQLIQRNITQSVNNLLEKLYQPVREDQNIDHFLDKVTADIDWTKTINYVTRYWQKIGSKPEKPLFDRLELNYKLLKENMGDQRFLVEALKDVLVDYFKKSGFLDWLNWSSADNLLTGNSIALYAKLMTSIPRLVYGEISTTSILTGNGPPTHPSKERVRTYRDRYEYTCASFEEKYINMLSQFYSAVFAMKIALNTLTPREPEYSLPQIQDDVFKIILNRAYLQFVAESSKKFYGLGNNLFSTQTQFFVRGEKTDLIDLTFSKINHLLAEPLTFVMTFIQGKFKSVVLLEFNLEPINAIQHFGYIAAMMASRKRDGKDIPDNKMIYSDGIHPYALLRRLRVSCGVNLSSDKYELNRQLFEYHGKPYPPENPELKVFNGNRYTSYDYNEETNAIVKCTYPAPSM